MSVLFSSFNLPEKMQQALARMNYAQATPIQAQAIPFAMEGRDVLGSAQTGTGKTAAFSIPMIARLMDDPQAKALVLAPTRELAAQTLDVVHKLTSNNRSIRTALLIGGEPMGKQFAQLREDPRVFIGTPGRINDHLRRNPSLLRDVVFVAIDEADRMLDMGFSEQIDDVLNALPKERQTLMFSATFPEAIIKFSRHYLNNPQRVSVSPEKISAPKIKHEIKRTTDSGKYVDLLAELEARDGSVIIFAKTQHGTDRLATRLGHDGHPSIAIHGGLRQNQRDRAVRDFRQKRYRIMVATDVASRGLDIPHIEHVINYDLPQVAEDYIHRIGRTARAGAEGNAMAFVSPADTGKWNAINRLMNPGEAPMRAERGERRDRAGRSGRSNRPARHDGFKSGGFIKARGERFASNDQPKNDGQRADRPKFDRSKSDRFGNDRSPYDRPKADRFGQRAERGGKSWTQERQENGRDFDRPRKEGGKSSAKPHHRDVADRYAPRGEDRKPTDRHWNSKADRPEYRASEGPRGVKSGAKSFGARSEFKSDSRKEGFKEERHGKAPKKVKSAPAAKKPFKFKEHSRVAGKKRAAF